MFGEDFEEGGFLVVVAALEGGHKLHAEVSWRCVGGQRESRVVSVSERCGSSSV
jgi:hypothetical protein